MKSFYQLSSEYEKIFHKKLIIPINRPGTWEEFLNKVEKSIEERKPIDERWCGGNLPQGTLI